MSKYLISLFLIILSFCHNLYAETFTIQEKKINVKPDFTGTSFINGNLENDVIINIGENSYPLKKGGKVQVYLKPLYVKKAILAKDTPVTIKGTKYLLKNGEEVKFQHHYSFSTKKYEVSINAADIVNDVDVNIGGQTFTVYNGNKRHTPSVTFYQDGSVNYAFVRKRADIKVGKRNIEIMRDIRMSFHSNGAVERIDEIKDPIIMKYPEFKKHYITATNAVFYKSGAIKYIKQSLPVEVAVKTEKGDVVVTIYEYRNIMFHKNEKIAMFYVGKPVTLWVKEKKINVKKKQKLYLNEKGFVEKVL